MEKLEQWARDHALGDPAARAAWLVIARADLEGELLTAAELVRRSGVTRYLANRFLRRAAAQALSRPAWQSTTRSIPGYV
ncbi:hypothetical protein D3867_37120 (plasmid) [Azospirillum argentinense]|uniref:Uncharacterized protein n=1 Tax=Azospirillum brasilense TaxID=192 RepID=A0A4D8QB18_AZOBR|nr:hypothetical protein D3867_37120 [Azospirillum argentinense]